MDVPSSSEELQAMRLTQEDPAIKSLTLSTWGNSEFVTAPPSFTVFKAHDRQPQKSYMGACAGERQEKHTLDMYKALVKRGEEKHSSQNRGRDKFASYSFTAVERKSHLCMREPRKKHGQFRLSNSPGRKD